MIAVAGQAGEVGNGVERDVHAKRAGDAAVVLDPLPEVAVERRSIDQLEVQELRIDVGDDPRRSDLAAVGQRDADRAAVLASAPAQRPRR